MTLIISAVVGDYAIQVSDRRLTRAGQLVDDEANKAVLFCNRFIFAYTGLALVGSIPTDDWLTQVLVNSRALSISDATQSLAQQATAAFSQIGYNKQQKRHAFVGVGWAKLPNEAFFSPIICSVSNAHAEDGVWFDEASDEFKIFYLLGSSKPIFDVIPTGQGLPRARLDGLRRKLRRCFEHNTGPEPVAKYLAEEIRSVAESNRLVGRSLMVVCLPKRSVMENSPDLLTDLAPSSKITMQNVQSFYYLSDGAIEVATFGPNTACGGQGFRNVGFEKLNESGTDAKIQATIVLPR